VAVMGGKNGDVIDWGTSLVRKEKSWGTCVAILHGKLRKWGDLGKLSVIFRHVNSKNRKLSKKKGES